MIVEYIRYTIASGQAAEFFAAYEAAGQILQRDPHCLGWELSQSEHDPTRCTVRIEWDSPEGHLQGFRASPAFADFLALVGPFIGDIDEMEHYAIRQSTLAEPEKGRPTLFDWAGGRPALRRLMDRFYDRVEADDLLSGLFPGGVSEEHRDLVTTWWSEVLGGPEAYTALGGYRRMLAAPPRPGHHRRAAAAVRHLDEPSGRRCRAAGGSGVSCRPDGLPGVGHPTGHGQLHRSEPRSYARRRRRAGAGASPRPTWADPGRRPCPAGQVGAPGCGPAPAPAARPRCDRGAH